MCRIRNTMLLVFDGEVLSNMVEKVNLSPINPHALRHTHAVMLLESGVDVKTVGDRLGHTKINMTADVYLHVSGKQEEGNWRDI